MSTLLVALAFVAVLGPLVFVHELGHFFAAKLFKVRVEVFSLGFGPRLTGFRGGETDYRIAPIPLGGYVRMAGEYTQEADPADTGLLNNKPRWQRLVIMLAGPAVNVLFAAVVWWGLFIHGFHVADIPDGPPVVEAVAEASPAASAGLEPGDRIVAVGGIEIDSFETYREEVLFRPGQTTSYRVQRDGVTLELSVPITRHAEYQIGWDGVYLLASFLIDRVIPGGAAEEAGLKAGDRLLAVDGKMPESEAELVETIAGHAGSSLTLTVRRDEHLVDIPVVPRADSSGRGKIGIYFGRPTKFVRYGPVQAVGRSIEEIKRQSGLAFRTIAAIVKGALGFSALSGPLEIARISRQQIELGWIPLFAFMALLSLQLGVLNLLPIPVLDGGQVLILLVEAARGRDLSPGVKEKVLLTGFVMIVILMVAVIGMDFVKMQRSSAADDQPPPAQEQPAVP
ncbi:MAG: RIP metalloprotease RseP [Acidobacteriota bacterium]|nr:RIP metalloprotease RseP [Acidobacteriota bacterium]